MTVSEWILENHEKFENRQSLVKACHVATGRTVETIRKRASAMLGHSNIACPRKVDIGDTNSIDYNGTGFRSGISFENMMGDYDLPAKVRRGIVKMEEAKQMLKDDSFRRELEINKDDWKIISAKEEFEENVYDVRTGPRKGRIWGPKDFILRFKRRVESLD